MAKTRTKKRQIRNKLQTKKRQTRNKRQNLGRGVTPSKSITIQKEINDIPKEIINDLTKILNLNNNNTKKNRFINLIKKYYRNINTLKNKTEKTNSRIEKVIGSKTKQLEKWDKEVMPLKEKNFISKNKLIIYYEFLSIINNDINIININSNILNDENIHRNINNYFLDKEIDIYIQNLIDNIEYVIV